MRIGIDARLAWRRGVGTYVANLLMALSRVDPYHEYLVFSAPPELRKVLPTRRFRFLDPRSVPSRLGRALAAQPALYEQFWLPAMAMKHGVHLLHYTDNSSAVASGVPTLVTVHDTMFLRPLKVSYPRATLRQRLIDAYKKWAVPVGARAALAVITVSEFSRAGIVRDLKVPSDRVFVTPEGVDPEVFSPDPKRRRDPRAPRILIHAADDERKNLPNLLKAFSAIRREWPGAVLMAMGMDEAGLARSGAAALVRQADLGRSIQWLGEVSRPLLRETYLKADLLLFASRWEGFGLPVLEAFACGVPVVASNATATPEVAGNAALLVDPGDPDAIAAACRRVLGSPAFSRALARRGLLRAKYFAWDRTARLTLDVYRKAALELEYDRHGRRRETAVP